MTGPPDNRASMLIELCAQRLLKVRKHLFRTLLFTHISKLMAQYMLIDNDIYQIQLFATRSEGLSQLSQQKALVDDGDPVKS